MIFGFFFKIKKRKIKRKGPKMGLGKGNGFGPTRVQKKGFFNNLESPLSIEFRCTESPIKE